MSYRTLTVALATATVLFATQSYAQTKQPGDTKADKTTTINASKSNNLREGPQKGADGPAEVINLNSSRSNVNRMGGGGGTGKTK